MHKVISRATGVYTNVQTNSVIYTCDKERETLTRIVGNLVLELVSTGFLNVFIVLARGGIVPIPDVSVGLIADREAESVLWHAIFKGTTAEELGGKEVYIDVKGQRKLREDDTLLVSAIASAGSWNFGHSLTVMNKLA